MSKPKPCIAQRRLDFDGNGRVGALQVGAGDDYAVDVGGGLAGALQGLLGSSDTHLAEDRPLVVRALGQSRLHALRVEDAVLVHDEAALDAAGFLDEGGARFSQCLHLAGFDGGGIVSVELRRRRC
jgi:hypothetical protein